MTLFSTEPGTFNETFKGLTLPEVFLREANRHATNGKNAFLLDASTGEEVLYSDFDRLTGNLAAWFHSKGLRKGDMVLFMARRTAKISIFLTGVWRANGIGHATYEQDLANVIQERVLENQIRFIYCDDEAIPKVREAARGCPWEVTILTNQKTPYSDSLNEIFQTPGTPATLEIGPKDPCTVNLTSGSTGKPKGAWRSHEGWLHYIHSSSSGAIYANPYDRLLVTSSAVHMTGLELPACGLLFGATVIVQVDCSALKILETIHTYKPLAWFTFSALVNDVFTHPQRAQYDLSSLDNVALGGSMVPPELYETLRCLTPNVSIVYGSTEAFFTGPRRMLQPDGKYIVEHRKGLEVGTVLPGGHMVQIRDVETGAILGPNQSGEVCTKGPSLFGGYLHLPAKTAEAFTSDGFYRMGDQGYYDEQGIIYIQGRLKDTFKLFNNHISPDEIDMVVSSHPAVKECITFGVSYPLGPGEFVPRTLVVLRDGAVADPEEIRTFAHARLPNYKYIRGGLYILDKLPRTTADKISRPLASKLDIPNAYIEKAYDAQEGLLAH